MSLKLPVYSELVKAFYSNLEIQESTLISEVFGIKMVIDQSLFYDLTQLSNDGVPFEGALDDDWKFDFLCMMPTGWFAPMKQIWPEGYLPIHWLLKATSSII